ncbi:hypothetical protein CHLNCDRAFT_56893 [Chlorella variabilis]|uniref:Peptidase M16 C-terminal domain-containing protein n=1 Tax=Chlorella variabilis TaxID=554065 RepID=E1Z5P3_CHLVA|nr:hypothetical protein CHLNCDRAFT_56893 [Chlorella variabilis]EFN58791.1 hypothetical protein CHLNCDRAFT_56893 [Chlorella variabilis]|eukprot:XP_005850893.1 hypothetical protein CHLNCDRAFT_56893 [Chlorella variabilis]
MPAVHSGLPSAPPPLLRSCALLLRSNAYTDFHHTVFHVHAPDRNGNTGQPMLWQVLDALTEVAFEPEFLPSRIEKERKAVVAEAQMMNTIEYRVDCQLLQYLHWENALGCRFPIGKTDQLRCVEQWEREEIMGFWARHYFPANATVYVVGDVDVEHTKDLIQQTFGRIPPSLNQPSPAAASVNAELLADAAAAAAASANGSSNGNGAAAAQAAPEATVLSSESLSEGEGAPPSGGASASGAPNGAILGTLARQRGMVSVVGDIDGAELEACVLKYLGTVSAEPKVAPAGGPALGAPLQICQGLELAQRHMTWHLKDSDERACAYIAGAAPNRWGNFTASQQQGRRVAAGEVVPPPLLEPGAPAAEVQRAAEIRRAHPLYASIALGWWHVNVTSTPAKIQDAMMASLNVLRNIKLQPITQRELLRAKRTLITRHDSDLKDNLYWLGLLTHLQADCVPLKSLDCLRDLRSMYEAAGVEDVYDAYNQFKFDDDSVFTCIGTSGKEPLATPSPILARRQQQQPLAAAAAGWAPSNGGARPPTPTPPTPPTNVDPDQAAETFMAAFKTMLSNMGGQQPGGRHHHLERPRIESTEHSSHHSRELQLDNFSSCPFVCAMKSPTVVLCGVLLGTLLAVPAGRAQSEGGCVAIGQQVLGACEQERNVINQHVPLSSTAPTAQQTADAMAALESAEPPTEGCCTAVETFSASDCLVDETLIAILPSVGISRPGLNVTLAILEQVCF